MKNPESKALEFIFQDTEIHFLLGNEKNVMVNATEMAKLFGKRVDHFTKSEHFKQFVEVAIQPPNGVRLDINSEKDLIENKGRNGIYFHRVLALKFAAWLDAGFELWIYITIEEILFGDAKKVGSKISEISIQKEKIKALKQNILEKGSEDAKQLLEEEKTLKLLEKGKTEAMSQFALQFK